MPYYYEIRAVSGPFGSHYYSESDLSSPAAFATTRCGPVQGLTATAQSSTQIRVEWKSLGGFCQIYAILRDPDWTISPKYPITTDTYYVDKGLTPSTTYCYWVVGQDPDGILYEGKGDTRADATTPAA